MTKLTPLYAICLATIVVPLIHGCAPGNKASTVATSAEIIQAIDNDSWIFKATTTNPQYGRTRQVNDIYDVRFGKDTMVVRLPYFGRSYTGADILNNKSPLDFTSHDLSFEKERKGDHWTITVKPIDNPQVQSMIFLLYESGSAQLNVTLTNRSSISFTGNVREKSEE